MSQTDSNLARNGETAGATDRHERALQLAGPGSLDDPHLVQLTAMLAEHVETMDRLTARVAHLVKREGELRALLADAHQQLAIRDTAVQRLRTSLGQVEQERDRLRGLVREALHELEDRDCTIDSLRKKRKTARA